MKEGVPPTAVCAAVLFFLLLCVPDLGFQRAQFAEQHAENLLSVFFFSSYLVLYLILDERQPEKKDLHNRKVELSSCKQHRPAFVFHAAHIFFFFSYSTLILLRGEGSPFIPPSLPLSPLDFCFGD